MSRRDRIGIRCAALVVHLVVGSWASLVAGEEPTSTFRETSMVTVVEVPVIVLRGGAPVSGLSAGDFILTQDGVEQAIEGFEQIDLSMAVPSNSRTTDPPVSLAGRRYFLLAFDLSHTQPVNARRAVEAARDLLEGGLHPTDLVGVSIYGAVAGARLLHPFTSDKAQLNSALLAVEAVTSRDPKVVEQARASLAATGGETAAGLLRFLEEIREFATHQGVGLESTIGPAGEWLEGFDDSGWGAMMAEVLQFMEDSHQENTIYVTRDRSLDLLETLADMADALEEVRGQKYFVLFSEGIDHSYFEDYSNTLGNRRLAGVLESFRRSGWIMQSVNVARLSDEFDLAERGMFALVNETDGREYRNFGRLDEAMGQMLERTSISYVLSFQPRDLVYDRSYHQIEVRLRQPGGAKVKHRDGYYAPETAEIGKGKDSLVAVADRIASERDGGAFGVSALAVPFKNAGDTALVKAIVEIDGSSLLGDRLAAILTLEIETYLMGEDTGAISLSNRRLTLDSAKQGELLQGGGIKVIEDYLLESGHHRLRFAVVDVDGGRRSVATALVSVPELRNDEPLVLEPIFPELSRHWLVVRDSPGEASSGDGTPIQFGGRKFIPQVDVSLESGVRVPICVLAYDLPETNTELQLELLAADGNPSAKGRLELVSEPERAENGLLRVMAELDTTDLLPGEYEIRVSYGGSIDSSGPSSSRAIEIR